MTIEEFFGDGAGNAVALPVEGTWVSGQELDPLVADPCDLICRGNVSVALATNIEVRVQIRDRTSVAAGDWLTLPMPLDGGTHIGWTDMVARVSGALAAASPFMFHVPGGYGGQQSGEVGHDVRLQARRIGGGMTTAFYVDGERRYNRDSPSMLSLFGGSAGAGVSLVGAPFVSRAPLIVTGAYVDGVEFEAGDANYLSILVAKTLAGNPTNVDFRVQSSVDAGVTWRTLPQVDGIAAGVTTEQAMTVQTTEIGAAVGNFEYAVPIFPGRRYRVGVLFTGGTAPTLGINCQLFRI